VHRRNLEFSPSSSFLTGPSGGGGPIRSRLFVVGKDRTVWEELSTLLRPRHALELFEDSQLALEAARRAPPDLILVELVTSQCREGLGLLGALRNHVDAGLRAIPVIAFGALGRDGRSCAFEAGANDFVLRPFCRHELWARIDTQLDLAAFRLAGIELQRREERFRSLIENSSDLITVVSREGFIRYQSPSAERVLGYRPAELIDRNAFDFVHPEDVTRARAAHQRAWRDPAPRAPVEYRFRHRDGSWLVLQSIGRRMMPAENGEVLIVVNSRDVTTHKQLEAQLRQAQKMEIVGQLAGGVAHDFNNLLLVISGHRELLEQACPRPVDLRDSLAEIGRAVERAAGLTRQLLAFSRRQVLEPKVLDLNGVVTAAEKMLRRLIGEDVRLITNLEPGLSPVRADPGQLDQVILNLALNARDAMPQGGILQLETRELEVDPLPASRFPPDAPSGGRYVVLTVSDTGTGMTPEVQARIFEPFFTTKAEGQGTGLGLSVAHGIVQQSGGHLQVASRPGCGTTFTVYLPAVRGLAVGRMASAPGRPVTGRGETVLLAEDEDPVRAVTAQLLHVLGYRVLQASSGAEALRLAETSREKIHLLLADVVMPGLSGRQLADTLRSRDPGLKVLFQSGYTDDAIIRCGISQAEVAFLQKPFTVDVLAEKLREILDSKMPQMPQAEKCHE
jgi:two-component system cell cycle sensor histidine kinase/response regulator CckA